MHTEIVKQIIELPVSERVEIIEEVSRSVRRDLKTDAIGKSDDERKQLRSEAIRRLRGIASVPGKRPPTDQEVKDMYTDYLIEKYK